MFIKEPRSRSKSILGLILNLHKLGSSYNELSYHGKQSCSEL